ncbi:MAG: heparan-alpha-glucosaminide N-acetyltransferase domain-containing protein [Chitinophagaceae bacterium]
MRIQALDLAKGFTVLMIAPIHSCMLYSLPYVRETFLGNFFAFIAEGPGAQLFMTAMGISFTFSKHTFRSISQRAFFLLIIGYALNIFKFIIPLWLGILPKGFRNLLPDSTLKIFVLGDILQFASIALIVIFLIQRIISYQNIAWILAAIICLISPLMWDIHKNDFFVDYTLQLVGGKPPDIYFPLFPWLVYPLTGLAIGYNLQQRPDKPIDDFKYIGCFLIIAGQFFDNGKTISFYRTYPPSTLQHIGIVLITFYVWNIFSRYVSPNYFFSFLTYMSRNITQIYCIQWILVCWMLPIFGYQQLDLFSSISAMVIITACTLFVSIYINFFKDGK